MGKYDDKILDLIIHEPKTPNEIAKELNLRQGTVQLALFRLAMKNSDIIGYKNVGRLHLFWRKPL